MREENFADFAVFAKIRKIKFPQNFSKFIVSKIKFPQNFSKLANSKFLSFDNFCFLSLFLYLELSWTKILSHVLKYICQYWYVYWYLVDRNDCCCWFFWMLFNSWTPSLISFEKTFYIFFIFTRSVLPYFFFFDAGWDGECIGFEVKRNIACLKFFR